MVAIKVTDQGNPSGSVQGAGTEGQWEGMLALGKPGPYVVQGSPLSFVVQVTVVVSGVNEAPTVTANQIVTISESYTLNTIIWDSTPLRATDPDSDYMPQLLKWRLADGWNYVSNRIADASKKETPFRVLSDGNLVLKGIIDFEDSTRQGQGGPSHVVPVVVTDRFGLSSEPATFTVRILDENEPPLVEAGPVRSISETATPDTLVAGVVKATDADEGGSLNGLVFSIAPDEAGQPPKTSSKLFTVDQLTGALKVRRRADIDAAKTANDPYIAGYVDRHAPHATSPSATYYPLDYEALTRKYHDVRVLATDRGGLSSPVATIRVAIEDANEPPSCTSTADAPALVVVNENTARGTVVSTSLDTGNDILDLGCTDPDAADQYGAQLTYHAVRRASSAAPLREGEIDPWLVWQLGGNGRDSRVLSVVDSPPPPVNALDFESRGTEMDAKREVMSSTPYVLTVEVRDKGSLSFTATVHVVIKDVNEAPVIGIRGRDFSSLAIREDASPGAAVGFALTFTDEDRYQGTNQGQKITVTVADTFAAKWFHLDGLTGQITVKSNAKLSYVDWTPRGNHDRALHVTATDALGLSATAVVPIRIINVNDRPVFRHVVDPAVQSAIHDSSPGYLVYKKTPSAIPAAAEATAAEAISGRSTPEEALKAREQQERREEEAGVAWGTVEFCRMAPVQVVATREEANTTNTANTANTAGQRQLWTMWTPHESSEGWSMSESQSTLGQSMSVYDADGDDIRFALVSKGDTLGALNPNTFRGGRGVHVDPITGRMYAGGGSVLHAVNPVTVWAEEQVRH